MTRRERSRIESLLGAAVAASVYDLRGTKASLAQFRRWARLDATELGWVTVDVPQAEANRLGEALSPVLKRFTNPETGHIGFAVCDVIGGMEETITLDRLTAGMVKSAAILGPDTVVSAVLAWAGGDPGTYVTTWVLRGIELPEHLELRDRGIRFERLPDWGGDPFYGCLSPYLEGTRELLSKPVLRIDTTIDPMFYMPRTGEDVLDRATRIRNTAIATPALEGLKLSKLLDALSLVCRSSVYSTYEWNEYPDEMLLMRHAAQTGPLDSQRAAVRFTIRRCTPAHDRTPRARDDGRGADGRAKRSERGGVALEEQRRSAGRRQPCDRSTHCTGEPLRARHAPGIDLPNRVVRRHTPGSDESRAPRLLPQAARLLPLSIPRRTWRQVRRQRRPRSVVL